MRFVSEYKNSLQWLFFYAYAFWLPHAKRTPPMTDWPLPQTYRFNGRSVRYAVRGDGPPLVFVHGTPFSSYVWHRIAPHFITTHRVHYFDLLGYCLLYTSPSPRD